jgi:hypothetical protein
MFWYIIFGVVVALGGTGAVLWWRQRGRKEEASHSCRCPKCDRKIRYPASQIGHYAYCPGCKHRVPLRDEEDDEGPRDQKPEGYHLRRRGDNAREA